jgi:PAS domain S-box-containing protein
MSNRAQNKAQNVILDSKWGVFTIDLDLRITSFNRAAEKITGIQREKAIGQKCRDVMSADTQRGWF